MQYRCTTGCDGCAMISACGPDSSWALSFLRCVALPGLTMWYYTFEFTHVKLESITHAKRAVLCSSTALRICLASHRATSLIRRHRPASVSRYPGPPPSCAQDPPQVRSRPQAVVRREAKVANVEFFVHC
jgi:hypothetical protein